MANADAVDEFWKNQADTLRTFIEIRPKYERLSNEVAYIAERLLRTSGIEFAHIAHRAKSLESFCEKCLRKNYKNPLKEITDFAGVRVVYLYPTDRTKIEKLIEENFQVLEKNDSHGTADPDKFGYGALHYVLQLGKRDAGVRYDELKTLACEIQVRTILQDAWAVVAHHLSYKQESDVPKALRRKLNALAGLFETADDQFNRLRDERAAYAEEIKKQIAEHGPAFLDSEINFDTLIEYIKWRFPQRKRPTKEIIPEVLREIKTRGYKLLSELNAAIDATEKAMLAYEAKFPPIDRHQKHCLYAGVGLVRVALEFADDMRGRPKAFRKEERAQFHNLVNKSKLPQFDDNSVALKNTPERNVEK